MKARLLVLFVLACLLSIVVHSGSVSVRGTVAQAAAYPTLALARRRLPFVIRTPTRLPALARLGQFLVFSGAAPHVIIIWATPIYTISLSELHVNDTTFVPVSGSRTVGVAGRLAYLYIDSAHLYADPFYSLVQWQDSGVAHILSGSGGSTTALRRALPSPPHSQCSKYVMSPSGPCPAGAHPGVAGTVTISGSNGNQSY